MQIDEVIRYGLEDNGCFWPINSISIDLDPSFRSAVFKVLPSWKIHGLHNLQYGLNDMLQYQRQFQGQNKGDHDISKQAECVDSNIPYHRSRKNWEEAGLSIRIVQEKRICLFEQ